VKTDRAADRATHLTSSFELADRLARPASRLCGDYSRDLIKAASSLPDQFSYGVVIGTQSLVLYHRDSDFRRYVQGATLLLAAGKASAWLVERLYGIRIPVHSGLSVTRMVHGVARPADRILWVSDGAVCSREAFPTNVHDLRTHRLRAGRHSVERCIDFIETNAPFRYCLLSIRSPWQELIAGRLMRRGNAKGLALCVGAFGR